ncbi:hypothetical protein GJ496_008109 [Pomphorhynchus laevis]|nr:hypothetical protein GJ496_008109 [Pomphorhynchus laevis]
MAFLKNLRGLVDLTLVFNIDGRMCHEQPEELYFNHKCGLSEEYKTNSSTAHGLSMPLSSITESGITSNNLSSTSIHLLSDTEEINTNSDLERYRLTNRTHILRINDSRNLKSIIVTYPSRKASSNWEFRKKSLMSNDVKSLCIEEIKNKINCEFTICKECGQTMTRQQKIHKPGICFGINDENSCRRKKNIADKAIVATNEQHYTSLTNLATVSRQLVLSNKLFPIDTYGTEIYIDDSSLSKITQIYDLCIWISEVTKSFISKSEVPEDPSKSSIENTTKCSADTANITNLEARYSEIPLNINIDPTLILDDDTLCTSILYTNDEVRTYSNDFDHIIDIANFNETSGFADELSINELSKNDLHSTSTLKPQNNTEKTNYMSESKSLIDSIDTSNILIDELQDKHKESFRNHIEPKKENLISKENIKMWKSTIKKLLNQYESSAKVLMKKKSKRISNGKNDVNSSYRSLIAEHVNMTNNSYTTIQYSANESEITNSHISFSQDCSAFSNIQLSASNSSQLSSSSSQLDKKHQVLLMLTNVLDEIKKKSQTKETNRIHKIEQCDKDLENRFVARENLKESRIKNADDGSLAVNNKEDNAISADAISVKSRNSSESLDQQKSKSSEGESSALSNNTTVRKKADASFFEKKKEEFLRPGDIHKMKSLWENKLSNENSDIEAIKKKSQEKRSKKNYQQKKRMFNSEIINSRPAQNVKNQVSKEIFEYQKREDELSFIRGKNSNNSQDAVDKLSNEDVSISESKNKKMTVLEKIKLEIEQTKLKEEELKLSGRIKTLSEDNADVINPNEVLSRIKLNNESPAAIFQQKNNEIEFPSRIDIHRETAEQQLRESELRQFRGIAITDENEESLNPHVHIAFFNNIAGTREHDKISSQLQINSENTKKIRRQFELLTKR